MKIVDLAAFKERHLAEKLFIIGTGPSLTYDVLDSLRGQTTIAMNNIAIAYPFTDWRPTYYLNVSRSFRGDKHWIDMGMKSINEAKHSFIWVRNAIVPMDEGTDACVTWLSCTTVPLWQKDKMECVSRWGSSIFAALQLAEFMGFGHIFLIGCDLGYYADINVKTKEDRSHFDPDYLGDTHTIRKARKDLGIRLMRDEIRTYTCHEIAAAKLRQGGVHVKICNAGPLLNIYEHMPLDEAVAYTPTYYRPKKRTE